MSLAATMRLLAEVYVTGQDRYNEIERLATIGMAHHLTRSEREISAQGC